jgi:hypothetical protein
MAGVTSQGATFTFRGFSGAITGIQVEYPKAEITDMTSVSHGLGYVVLVPTNDWSAGSFSVDYIRTPETGDPQDHVRKVSQLTMASSGFTISKRVVCESASNEVRVGELVRGNLKFTITDYTMTS